MKDDEGCTPLIKAAQRDNLECISILLRRGANPHIIDASGYTALHHAICRGNIPVVSKLLEYNVDIKAKTEYGFTPCTLALFANQYQMARFLIEYSEGAPSELTPNRLSENPHVTTEDTATTAIKEDIDNSSSRYTVETKKGGFLPPPNMHDIVPQPPAHANVTSTFHVSERGDNLQSSEETTVNTTSVDHTPSSDDVLDPQNAHMRVLASRPAHCTSYAANTPVKGFSIWASNTSWILLILSVQLLQLVALTMLWYGT